MFETNKLDELTSRQREILTLVQKGLTNNEICKTLGISANTVKVHLANIYKVLEVTNRTEAATIANSLKDNSTESYKDLIISFHTKGTLSEQSKVYSLYLSIVEAIHQYHLFRITDDTDKDSVPGFRIEVSTSDNEEDTLHISTKIGNSHEILWTNAIKLDSENPHDLAHKSATLLFRNLVLASAKLKYTPDSPLPYWWFASSFCYAKLENRAQESFEISKKMLEPITAGDTYSEFALYTLSLAYYIAIFENWGNVKEHVEKLGGFARKAMYNAPYSLYSQMIMALYNISIGNKTEAIAYLTQVIKANPQFVVSRTILMQLYMLTGQDKLAMELIEDSKRHIPEQALQPTYSAQIFMLLLQGKFDECKNKANQILLFNPKAMAIRLCMIACCNIKGETAESEKHLKQLYKYYPNFTQKDVEQMLKGVDEQKQAYIKSCLQNIFTSTNPQK